MIASESVASDRLALFLNWYDNARQRGYGQRAAANRAAAIVTLDDHAVDALIEGRICAGEEAKYVDIICHGSKTPMPAFKVGDMYYCSCCGSPTRRTWVEVEPVDRRPPVETPSNGKGVRVVGE